jgi:hypothetical protein
MTDVNWRAFAEELLRDLEDARIEMGQLGGYSLEFSADYKTAKLADPNDPSAAWLLEASEAEEVLDDLADAWRRRLLVAQIEDDRTAA